MADQQNQQDQQAEAGDLTPEKDAKGGKSSPQLFMARNPEGGDSSLDRGGQNMERSGSQNLEGGQSLD